MSQNFSDRSTKSPLAVPLTVVGLVLLAGGSFWLGRASVGHGAETTPMEEELAGVDAPPSPLDGSGAEAEDSVEPGVADHVAAVPAPAQEKVAGGLRDLSVSIQGSLTRTFGQELGTGIGDPLALVTGRLLVWWLDLTKDLRKGDMLHLVYELQEGAEPVVHAVSFTSQKLGKTFHAYRYQGPGAPFPRYYDKDGQELEMRLERSPIQSYEQITSLLRDGRRHAGVDFKGPVGTPITSPWSGVVTRTNFNTRVNGNCVEMKDAKGRLILFLHLSEVAPEMKAGARVQRGQRVGALGNTGRSTAPHLHYQMMSKAGRVLDPFREHPTYRTAIDPAQRAGFQEAMRRLDGRLRLVAAAD